jgi:glycolate oxidase iron-sulfur subunit
MIGKRLLPHLTGQTLHTLVQKRPKTRKGAQRVLFFAGCMITYVNPGIGQALMKVLERNGVDVVVPKEQACCGLPSLAAGDRETFEGLRQLNLKVLREMTATRSSLPAPVAAPR